VVEGTFMCMCDFLLPCNIAGCVCRRQIAKWYMHSSSPPFVLHFLPISSSLSWSF
jgi:hypothetical protein